MSAIVELQIVLINMIFKIISKVQNDNVDPNLGSLLKFSMWEKEGLFHEGGNLSTDENKHARDCFHVKFTLLKMVVSNRLNEKVTEL